MTDEETIEKGAYVFATKYDDGDPGDAWAVGYYMGQTLNGRHLVGDGKGVSYRRSGYGRVRAGLRDDAGHWLMANNEILESSPPGMINLWGMLGEMAFDGAFEDKRGYDPFALRDD